MSLTSYQTAPPCNTKNFKSSSMENEEWGEKGNRIPLSMPFPSKFGNL